jgi:hypothetical protein
MKTIFIAYPGSPPQLGSTIEAAAEESAKRGGCHLRTWRELDIPGHFLASAVLDGIDGADAVVADITRLNFNVTFEIGYALGCGKRTILIQNPGLQPAKEDIDQLGLFDTIGWANYSSSTELLDLVAKANDIRGLRQLEKPVQRDAPVYLVQPLHKDDASVHTVSRLTKTRLNFRSFDPNEQSRLSGLDAILNVAMSAGVVVRLLSKERTDHWLNNLRGSFIAGLAHGLKRELLLLQEPADPVPLDYRDFVCEFRDNSDIERHINEFAPRVVGALQAVAPAVRPVAAGLLETISLGASAAENELASLAEYYVKTDEFRRAVRGEFRIAVGRKGTGKSALFFQARDLLRSNNQNIVLDLKPEGHQFKRLREAVLLHLDNTSQEHLATAFWEYLLTLELAAKILEKDRHDYLRHAELLEPYQRLSGIFHGVQEDQAGDFSERVLALIQRLSTDFPEWRKTSGATTLTAGNIAHFVYTHDLPRMQGLLQDYLQYKEGAWILIDNLDKGWPTRGLSDEDVLLVRGLLDATRKLERHLARKGASLKTMVFLRNDVYELLLNETSDRGKESKVSLDWTDPDRLRELLRLRIVASVEAFSPQSAFDDVWRSACVSHVKGEESSEFLIEHCLMRPRNLINLVEYCRSNAVNLGHDRIQENDIAKAIASYSHDMCAEISLEIRDVFPQVSDNGLYAFLGAPTTMTLEDVTSRARQLGLTETDIPRYIEILLWFSFLGVIVSKNGDLVENYCHSVHYDMKKLRWLAGEFKEPTVRFAVHRAFRSFLETS